MIFDTLNPEKVWHENLTDLSTSPVRCSYFTLENPKKFTVENAANMQNVTIAYSHRADMPNKQTAVFCGQFSGLSTVV